ncbi:hypothetical protein [Streptomyces avermitilis]|uniref:hypothetical protein n=1 Tax=Streptomyces avermitilis TaxID=33903 RepID=UPI0033BFB489
MKRVQWTLGPESVGGVVAAVFAIGALEWRRVRMAQERRREREQELLAEMVSCVVQQGYGVRVRHGGAAGTWSLTGVAARRLERGEAGAAVFGHASVPGRGTARRSGAVGSRGAGRHRPGAPPAARGAMRGGAAVARRSR